MTASTSPILYFDGVCNLCNSSVQWIIRRDKQGLFRFAPLQSAAGAAAKAAVGDDLDSIILFHEGRYHTKSDAALRIAGLLGRPWSWLGVLRSLPKAVRNATYDFIARNRYHWFGKTAACMLPTPALQSRFLLDAPVPAASAV